MLRTGRAVVLLLACLTSAPGAYADTQKEACATAYEQAQRLYRDGRYGLARSQLAICTQMCPTSLSSDCQRWSRDVDDAMATVILAARDRQGRPLTEVRVQLDGQPLVDRLDGRPVFVEPGAHVFRFEVAEGVSDEEKANLARGVKGVEIVAQLSVDGRSPEPPASAAPPPVIPRPHDGGDQQGGGPPALGFVLAGIGVAGLGVGAVLGIKGQLDKKNLKSSCAPGCDASEVDSIRTEWWIAAASAAAGATAPGVAAILFATGRHASRSSPARTTLVVAPRREGATVAVGARF